MAEPRIMSDDIKRFIIEDTNGDEIEYILQCIEEMEQKKIFEYEIFTNCRQFHIKNGQIIRSAFWKEIPEEQPVEPECKKTRWDVLEI